MLSYFPARDVDEPVTKDFLRAELAVLRAEMEQNMRTTQAWMVGTGLSLGGLILATSAFLR